MTSGRMEAECEKLVDEYEVQERTSKEVGIDDKVSKEGVVIIDEVLTSKITVFRKLMQEFNNTEMEQSGKKAGWMNRKWKTREG